MIRTTNPPKVVGHVTSSKPEASHAEMGLLTLWLTITLVPPFPGVTVLLYLLVLYFVSYTILDSQRAWGAIGKSWIVLPLPILGVFSMFWSPYPAEAFRAALLFLTSAVVIIMIASKFSPKQVLRCLLIAGTIGTLYAALFISTANLGGPYVSKNYLAVHMLMTCIAGLATALDKETSLFLKVPILAIVALAAYIVVASEAVTSLLLLIGATTILLVIRFIFLGLAGVDGARTIIMLFGTVVLAAIALVLFNFVDPKIVDDFLAVFGKDSQLTGRTDLWAAAEKVIRDHPVFGVGLEGFWQYDVGAAQTLNENDFKEFGTKLGFHNAYLEVAAHLGLVGLGLFICAIIWVVTVTTSAFLRRPDMVSGAFFAIIIVSLVSSMTESVLWGTFNIPASMFFASGTLYSLWGKPRVVATLVARRAPRVQA